MHRTKKGADSSDENTYPKCPRIYLPNLSSQAQKFWISMKKGFIARPKYVIQTFSAIPNFIGGEKPKKILVGITTRILEKFCCFLLF